MVMTNVELYEAIKDRVGERAARLIAEAFPAARDLATKTDLITGMDALKLEMSQLELRIVGQMAALESRIMGRLWVMFVPLWLGVFGILGTLIATLFRP